MRIKVKKIIAPKGERSKKKIPKKSPKTIQEKRLIQLITESSQREKSRKVKNRATLKSQKNIQENGNNQFINASSQRDKPSHEKKR